MEEQKRALAYAIAEYLQNEAAMASEDARESLEVAVQCLESAYGFETGEEEARAQYSIAPNTLIEVFLKGTGKQADASVGSPMQLYGDNDEASREVSQADKDRADSLKNEGNDAVRRGDLQAAVGHYSEAIAVWPDNAVYYVNRAAAYTKLNKLDEAIRDCERGLELDPKYSKAFSRLGTCYFTQKRYDDAVNAYRKAAELEPDNQMYIDNLKAAEKKRDKMAASGGSSASAPAPRETAPPANPFGRGDFGGRGADAPANPAAGDALGGGLGSLLNNPNILGMAAQMMQNPAFQNLAQNLMSNPQGMPNFNEIANDPSVRNFAAQLAKDEENNEGGGQS